MKKLVAMLLRMVKVEKWHPELEPEVLEIVTSLSQLNMTSTSKPIIAAKFSELFCCIWQKSYSAQPINSNTCPDVTLRFIAYSSVTSSGSYLKAKNVTGILSKLKYLIRLTILETIHTISASNHREPFEVALELRQWYTEKVESPFNTVCTLQHLATSFAYNEQGMPSLVWLDNDAKALSWKGDEIELVQYKAMIAAITVKMINQLQILFLGDLICMPYQRLTEDMSDITAGYSFLADSRNQFEEQKQKMLDRIFASGDLQKQFLELRGSNKVWRHSALCDWLAEYRKLSQLMLLRCELLAGGPARGTELTAMTFISTPLQGQRNLSVVNGHVVLIRTHSKSHARRILHSLDGFQSSAIIHDLAILRPFAEFAAKKVFPDKPEIHTLYHTHIFVDFDKLFTTDKLSSCLSNWTAKHIGVAFTVSPIRHISIAWRRRLCSRETAFLDLELEGFIAAEQAGHSLRVEREHYGIASEGLMGCSEDMLPKYFEASASWQKAMGVVPGKH